MLRDPGGYCPYQARPEPICRQIRPDTGLEAFRMEKSQGGRQSVGERHIRRPNGRSRNCTISSSDSVGGIGSIRSNSSIDGFSSFASTGSIGGGDGIDGIGSIGSIGSVDSIGSIGRIGRIGSIGRSGRIDSIRKSRS